MTKRIFHYILSCSILVFILTTLFISTASYKLYLDEHINHLAKEADYISIGVGREGVSYLSKLPNSNDDLVLIFNEDKGEISSSRKNYSEYEKYFDLENPSEYLLRGGHKNITTFHTFSEEIILYSKLLDNGMILCIITSFDSIISIMFSYMLPIVIILGILSALSGAISMRIARKITNPLNTIDLENPNKGEIYEELSPLILRITAQNEQINNHIKDLEQQQQAFKTITSNMEEGLFLLNNRGEILSYNGGALDCMGITTKPKHQNILVFNRSEGFRRCIEGAMAGKHYEKVIDFDNRVFHIFANPVWEDEVVAGVVLMLIDVTEREQIESMRREFSANVSHELKTPLTSISGFAEIMKNGMVRDEDIQNFAGKIYDESQRLINLVKDIIKISKLDEESSDGEIEKVLVDIDEIINDTIERLEPIAKKDDIKIRYRSKPCEIMCNEQMMQEIIYNLCDNAIRYNKKGGQIKIIINNNTNEMILSVEDTGIGIKRKNQSRIFERFYRVSQSRSKIIDGTGLGLSIVKHGVLFHRGSINVESDYGKGTKICVHIPK